MQRAAVNCASGETEGAARHQIHIVPSAERAPAHAETHQPAAYIKPNYRQSVCKSVLAGRPAGE